MVRKKKVAGGIIDHNAFYLRAGAPVVKNAVERKTAAGSDSDVDKNLFCDTDRRLVVKCVVVGAEKTADRKRPYPWPLAQYFQRFKAVCKYRV